MRSRRFFGKLKKPDLPLGALKFVFRRVVGDSMTPTLKPGKVVLASGLFGRLKAGDVVIIAHDGLEKVKRVEAVVGDQLFVLGDNARASTDSRSFGWLPLTRVQAKVVWPKTARGER